LYCEIWGASAATTSRCDDGFLNTSAHYYHQDHLSNRLVTNSAGAVIEQIGHFTFGESWYNSTNDKLLFTTYERDSESGNDYAMARYDITRFGRFSSPDPIASTPSDPQSLNRYSYVRNSPTNFADPLGLFLVFLPPPPPGPIVVFDPTINGDVGRKGDYRDNSRARGPIINLKKLAECTKEKFESVAINSVI